MKFKRKESILIFHLDKKKEDLKELKTELLKVKTAQIKVKSFLDERALSLAVKKGTIPQILILNTSLNGDRDGFEIARSICELSPNVMILMYSDEITAEMVAKASQAGADDIISKGPAHFQADHFIQVYLESLVDRLTEGQSLPKKLLNKHHIIGAHTLRVARRLNVIISSGLEGGILVTGPTGTGKSFVTQIFETCLPHNTPIVSITRNSPSIAEIVDKAKGGWLVIDSLEAMSYSSQCDLYNILVTSKKKFRVLGTSSLMVDRLRDSSAYSSDLIRYLSSNRIILPPLHERPTEIPEFVSQFFFTLPGGPYILQGLAKTALCSYDYPIGNIAELKETASQMTLFASRTTITAASVPRHLITNLRIKQSGLAEPKQLSSEIRVPFNPESISFSEMSNFLLLKLIEHLQESDRYHKRRTSLRSLVDRIGIARNTLTSRIELMIDQRQVSINFLNKLKKGES